MFQGWLNSTPIHHFILANVNWLVLGGFQTRDAFFSRIFIFSPSLEDKSLSLLGTYFLALQRWRVFLSVMLSHLRKMEHLRPTSVSPIKLGWRVRVLHI